MKINEPENKKRRVQMSKELWLSFFNEYLFKNGFISQDERVKMNGKIAAYIGYTRR